MLLTIFPFLLFATAVGSAFLYQHTDHDIYGVLAVASAIVCIIWGLVVTHWLIHLLALVMLLKFTKNWGLKPSPSRVTID